MNIIITLKKTMIIIPIRDLPSPNFYGSIPENKGNIILGIFWTENNKLY